MPDVAPENLNFGIISTEDSFLFLSSKMENENSSDGDSRDLREDDRIVKARISGHFFHPHQKYLCCMQKQPLLQS